MINTLLANPVVDIAGNTGRPLTFDDIYEFDCAVWDDSRARYYTSFEVRANFLGIELVGEFYARVFFCDREGALTLLTSSQPSLAAVGAKWFEINGEQEEGSLL